MKTYIKTAAMMFFAIFTAINTWASTMEFIGTFQGNDPANPSADLGELETNVSTWLGYDVGLEFYAKVDAPDTTTTEGAGTLDLTYTMDDDESRSGTWQTVDAINLFSVKAGKGYALYWLADAATYGTWDTSERNDKEISHFSTWRLINDDPPAGVYSNPEPTTILLFGLGLMVFAWVGRKTTTR